MKKRIFATLPVVLWAILTIGQVQATAIIGAEQYRYLSTALVHFQKLAQSGQWQPLPPPPKNETELIDTHRQLHQQLELSGDLPAVRKAYSKGKPTSRQVIVTTESMLRDALKRFQLRHGLEPDGTVGRKTRQMLNLSPTRRAEIIAANLKRLSKLPMEPADRYVVVNAGNFKLDLVENGKSSLSMRIISGRKSRRTPIYSDTIKTVVLNPSWSVPNRIMRRDILPKLKKNPDYLMENKYILIQGPGWAGPKINPQQIDWSTIQWSPKAIAEFPYRLRQLPGKHNSLGLFKFDFPNRHSVYLHDTPNKNLFERTTRAFSSGCIRLEYPRKLAEALLQYNPQWSPEKLDTLLESGKTKHIRLSKQVPIHLIYQTAWIDKSGSIQIRPDIYQRDIPPDNFSLNWQPDPLILSATEKENNQKL